MEDQKISVKALLPYNEAVDYMKALVKSLESGKIVLENSEGHITLAPLENVEIVVKAKSKKGSQKISIEIGWAEPGKADLKISDREPEVAAVAAKPEAPVVAEPAAEESADKSEKDKKEKKEKKDKKEKKEKKDKKKDKKEKSKDKKPKK